MLNFTCCWDVSAVCISRGNVSKHNMCMEKLGEDFPAFTSDGFLSEDVPFGIDLFEIVQVLRGVDGVAGRRGTVVGQSRSEDGTEFYALMFDGVGTELFARSDLKVTGRRQQPGDIYRGTSIRVNGRGEVVG